MYYGDQFAVKGATPTAMPQEIVGVYIEALRRPGALHASFQYYRALDRTIAQNKERVRTPLPMPVLAALYRHFPNRAALLEGLVIRSLRVVVDALRDSAAEATVAIDAARGYLYRMIEKRDQLILPLRGGPRLASAEAAALRAEVHRALEGILARGVADGSIRLGFTRTISSA